MREGYVYFTVADYDLFDEGFNDFPLVLKWQFRSTVMERAGLVKHVIGRQLVDFQEVQFGLKFGQFGLQLLYPFFGGRVP